MEEVKQEQIEEMHEQLPNHLHVLKRLDGKYSVIKEVDADEVEEVVTFDDKESAEAYKAEQNGDKTEEAKPSDKTEVEETTNKQVEITDTDGEEPSDPEEVKQFEEELAKTAQR